MSIADDVLGTAFYYANRPGREPEQRLGDLLGLTARYRADALAARLLRANPRVRSGPFAGMVLPVGGTEGCLAPKLLGCYESELHEPIAARVCAGYHAVINIGCAEGFYAVGLARALPGATVHAFDSDERAQRACRETASANGVADRVEIGGTLDPDGLERLCAALAAKGDVLVVCDIEGAEAELLDPTRAPSLARTDLLVELHPMFVAGCDALITQRFTATHEMARIGQRGRDDGAFPEIGGWSQLDRFLALWEFRPPENDWLSAVRKRA